MTTHAERVEVMSERTATPTGTQARQVYVRGDTTPTTPLQYETKKTIFRAYQVIWYILGVLEILLLFRLFLKAVAANPSSGFTQFIYTVTEPFAGPFLGVFRIDTVNGSVFEWTTILAMVVYFLIAYALVKIFQFIKPVSPEEVDQEVDNT